MSVEEDKKPAEPFKKAANVMERTSPFERPFTP